MRIAAGAMLIGLAGCPAIQPAPADAASTTGATRWETFTYDCVPGEDGPIVIGQTTPDFAAFVINIRHDSSDPDEPWQVEEGDAEVHPSGEIRAYCWERYPYSWRVAVLHVD